MAKKALILKAAAKPKFAVRAYTRCQRCGRPKAVYRKFGLCRVCIREMAHRGELPGVSPPVSEGSIFTGFTDGLGRARTREQKLSLDQTRDICRLGSTARD